MTQQVWQATRFISRDDSGDHLTTVLQRTFKNRLFFSQTHTGAERSLFRTLAGLEHFARTNAHHPRRKIHPDLSNDPLKHSCLYCLTKFPNIIEDSGWHAFCECPGSDTARNRFCLDTASQINCSNPCSVNDLLAGSCCYRAGQPFRRTGALRSQHPLFSSASVPAALF